MTIENRKWKDREKKRGVKRNDVENRDKRCGRRWRLYKKTLKEEIKDEDVWKSWI